MWRFTRAGAEIFCFAGLWDSAHTSDGIVESFTILTCAPGPDCAPYHTRQPVIVEPEHWGDWLDLTADAVPLMTAGPAGTIHVERAVEAA
jgi:putative SOS response-associated peptidase YedK